MQVLVLHLGPRRWIVQPMDAAAAERFFFDPAAAYEPLGHAAGRSYVSPGDVIDVNEADLEHAP